MTPSLAILLLATFLSLIWFAYLVSELFSLNITLLPSPILMLFAFIFIASTANLVYCLKLLYNIYCTTPTLTEDELLDKRMIENTAKNRRLRRTIINNYNIYPSKPLTQEFVEGITAAPSVSNTDSEGKDALAPLDTAASLKRRENGTEKRRAHFHKDQREPSTKRPRRLGNRRGSDA